MSEKNSQQRSCPGCGRSLICGMEAGWERCWCAELPALPAEPEKERGCYCPECLKAKLAEALKPS